MACRKCFSRKATVVWLWIALVILAISLVMIFVFPAIYNSVLKRQISLEEGSIMTGIWKDIPIPIYEKLYFFNITNRENFKNGLEPLNVTEVGPYTYKSRWTKNPFWNPNNTVSYREVRTYQFVPEMSVGSQDDEIYTLNGPLLIAASIAKDYDETERAALSVLLGLEGETVVIKRKIRELVYDGYDDFIIKYATLIKPNIPYKDGKFSWLYGKNATDDGLFTVFTGVDGQPKKGILNNWNGQEKLTFWKGDTCNTMNGTSIEIGPPIHGYQEDYTFFQSIFCRSLSFNYTGDVDHFDIPSKRFRPTYSLFANSTENPDNHCFEVTKERPSGVLDVSSCQFGAPVFISFPHFYMADSSYLESVNALSPNDEQHGSHLDVEPITGITIHIVVRFQINVEISKVTGIFQTYKPTKGIFPLLWVDLNLKINEEFANVLKGQTRTPKVIAYSVLGALAVISLAVAILCLVRLFSSNSEADDDEPLLNAGEYPPYYGRNVNSRENFEDVAEKEQHRKNSNPSERTNKNLDNNSAEYQQAN